MIVATRARLAPALAVACAILFAAPAAAQEIADGHLKAARAAVAAIRATEPFDEILPAAATALKGELINKNPDLEATIVSTVDEKTLALAARRGDLEREAAAAYARAFSEEELNAIAAFYESPAGQKLLSQGPTITREVFKAGEIWQRGIARDLAQSVGEALAAQAPAPAPEAAPAPVEGAN